MSAGGGFDLDAAAGFAFAALGMGPRDAWAMTPRELALAARFLVPARAAPARADLDGLMAAFPDRET